jgi:nucleoid DNA-binding protein
MNTVDLINKLSVKHNITTGRAEMIISIVVERMTEKLRKDGQVMIYNFGSFAVEAKKHSDTLSGKTQDFNAPKNYVQFNPDKKFLDAINN